MIVAWRSIAARRSLAAWRSIVASRPIGRCRSIVVCPSNAAAALALLVSLTAAPADPQPLQSESPAGIWNCLVYGDPIYGQERVVLWLSDDGRTLWAQQAADTVLPWQQVSDWTLDRRRRLSFTNPRRSRSFEAELGQHSLGGTWSTEGSSGGWWCARRSDAVAIDASTLRASRAEFFIPPLVPNVMASPRYPLEAIRTAKEGRVVACFLVDASGAIFESELVELSDEIFAEPTLRAVARSSYRPSTRGEAHRPGCRSYDFNLEVAR